MAIASYQKRKLPPIQLFTEKIESINEKAKFAAQKQELGLFLKKVSDLVDPLIKEILLSHVDQKNWDLVEYQAKTGGKRLRPALTVLSCLICGGTIKDSLTSAAGLEIAHNCSLINDDIIDNSLLRRGRPTLLKKAGKSISLCVSIDYSAAIFQAANQSKNPRAIAETFAKTMKQTVEGEIMDILFSQKGLKDEPYVAQNRMKKITLKDYLSMIAKKTALFLQTCCEVGGLCANASAFQIERLKKIGLYLGVAGQIKDDVLDVFGDEKEIGKEVGKDIKEGKLGNVVVLVALNELACDFKGKLLKILSKKQPVKKDINVAIDLIGQTNSQQRCLRLGSDFIKKAKAEINLLPQNQWSELLKVYADFILERNK